MIDRQAFTRHHAGMKPFMLMWMMAVLPVVTAQARLGETPAQCQTRYGAPLADPTGAGAQVPLIPGAPHALFFHEGWVIRVAFLDGLVAAQSYCKVELDPGHGAILDEEFAAIRKAEAGGRKWERSSFEIDEIRIVQGNGPPTQIPPPYEKGGSWNRADGATAFLLFGRRSVVVETREAAARRKKGHRPEPVIVKRPQF